MKRPGGLVTVTLLLLVFVLVEIRVVIAQVQRRTITYTDGSRYEGEIRDDKRHGRGIYVWSDGTRYEGDWHDGRKHGQGTFTWANGHRYAGEFRNDMRTGQGTYTWPDGGRYRGQFFNGKLHGRGTRAWANGERYEGEYRDDMRTGQGTYTWPNGHRYEGRWLSNKMHGQGTYTWPDGERYVGAYRDGRRSGQGTYAWPDGGRFVGEWRDDKKHGRGTRTWPDGRRYEGQWRSDRMHGRGMMIRADGSSYEGDWRDNRMHGQGTYNWPDGGRYVGELRNDRFHGRGTRTWADGNRYEGQWRSDRMHGRGTMIRADGSRYEGEWRDGKRSDRLARERQSQVQQQAQARNTEERRQTQRNPSDPKAEEKGLRLTQAMRKQIQSCLKMQGFDPGPSDGLIGPRTRAAIRAWQAARGQAQEASGYLAAESLDALLTGCRVAEQREAEEDLYGSIAFSQDSSGGYAWGIAWDYNNLAAARRQAIAGCQGRGGSNCAEQVWFRNACGALFVGDENGWGTGWGRSEATAEAMARAQCEGHNRNCRLAVSQCAVPATVERQQADRQRERQPEAEENLYGSIAFSQNPGGGYAWGMAWDYNELTAARRLAITECQDRGGSHCAEQVWFRNACGALFIGDENGWGAGWGRSKSTAEAMARAQCEGHNRNCRLAASQCAVPARVERQQADLERERQPEAEEDLYGSIAFSQNPGGGYAWGMAWDYNNLTAARRLAITECQDRGGSNCAEQVWFRNACGALFIGDENGWGAGWGRSKSTAEAMARAQCEGQDRNCRLVISQCATPAERGQQVNSAELLYWLKRGESSENRAKILELLDKGANPNVADAMGNTPMHYAALQTRTEGVLLALIRLGGHCGAKNRAGETPLHFAANVTRPPVEDFFKLLIECGAAPNARSKSGDTPLHKAFQPLFGKRTYSQWQPHIILDAEAHTHNEKTISRLLKYGSDPNIKDAAGDTPLIVAVELAAKIRIVELLLAHGANPETRNRNGHPLLLLVPNRPFTYSRSHRCSPQGEDMWWKIIARLIRAGADPNVTGPYSSSTILHRAAEDSSCLYMVKTLLEHGADPNRPDGEGNTPLHNAAKYAGVDVVDLLLKSGADPCLKNDDDRIAVEYASSETEVRLAHNSYPRCEGKIAEWKSRDLRILTGSTRTGSPTEERECDSPGERKREHTHTWISADRDCDRCRKTMTHTHCFAGSTDHGHGRR